MTELSDHIYDKIQKLSENGNRLADEGKYDEAILLYQEALGYLPQPLNDWEASTWLYASIGDMFFMNKEYIKAKDALYNALNGPDGISNSFICLRLGEVLFELNEFKESKENLLKAYMLEGAEIFKGEDSKYFSFIRDCI